MTWLCGPVVLLVVTLCVSSAQDKDPLNVRYKSETITSPRGSSVKLTCNVFYDFELCSLPHVVWCHLSKQSVELTDPRRYLTTVNETVSEDNMRHRQVVTEILSLTPEDSGQFQCKAECEGIETVLGHYIWITVRG
ncbi:uncharacterized protein zgc:174945 [Plectropomus leopardus]|uniref:uncharacterized protein zgc:174945 n=1 Tax=Plectropomus leopardus TaxID=160734 RepID=UPI001C4B8C5D|nr:uncharacterized protein zgc:174945 [Plectropomus leopardus]